MSVWLVNTPYSCLIYILLLVQSPSSAFVDGGYAFGTKRIQTDILCRTLRHLQFDCAMSEGVEPVPPAPMGVSEERSPSVDTQSQQQDVEMHTQELSKEDSFAQETSPVVEPPPSVAEEHIAAQQDQQVQLDVQLDDLAVARELEENATQSTPTLNVTQDLPPEPQSFVEMPSTQDNPEPSVSSNQSQQVEHIHTEATIRPSSPPEPPKSEYETLSEHLAKDPFDGVAWQALTTLADHSGNLEMVSNVYDRLLEVFPNTVGLACMPCIWRALTYHLTSSHQLKSHI